MHLTVVSAFDGNFIQSICELSPVNTLSDLAVSRQINTTRGIPDS